MLLSPVGVASHHARDQSPCAGISNHIIKAWYRYVEAPCYCLTRLVAVFSSFHNPAFEGKDALDYGGHAEGKVRVVVCQESAALFRGDPGSLPVFV